MNTDRYIHELVYKDKGRGDKYVDCWGLVQLAYKRELGIDLPSYDEAYASAHSGGDVEALIAQELRMWRPVDKPKPFDLVILRIEEHDSHCAIAINSREFLNITKSYGAFIGEFGHRYWKRRVTGIYRYVHPA